MITRIGIVAGEIWQILDSEGDLRVSQLIEKTDHKRDMILMSVGWLAREGHVLLSLEADEYLLTLRATEDVK